WAGESAVCIPVIRRMKNSSESTDVAAAGSRKPTDCDAAPESSRAASLGRQSSSSTTSSTRRRTSSEIPGLPLRAKEAAVSETPTRWAMSRSVGRFFGFIQFSSCDLLLLDRGYAVGGTGGGAPAGAPPYGSGHSLAGAPQ